MRSIFRRGSTGESQLRIRLQGACRFRLISADSGLAGSSEAGAVTFPVLSLSRSLAFPRHAPYSKPARAPFGVRPATDRQCSKQPDSCCASAASANTFPSRAQKAVRHSLHGDRRRWRYNSDRFLRELCRRCLRMVNQQSAHRRGWLWPPGDRCERSKFTRQGHLGQLTTPTAP